CPDTDAAQTYAVLQTGDTGFVNPRAYLIKNALAFQAVHNNGVSAVSSTATAAGLTAGDTVELLRIIDGTGAVTLRLSVNGGVEVVGATSGALAFAAAWNAPILSLFNVGGLRYYGGLVSVKSGPYGGAAPVNTLALARAA